MRTRSWKKTSFYSLRALPVSRFLLKTEIVIMQMIVRYSAMLNVLYVNCGQISFSLKTYRDSKR